VCMTPSLYRLSCALHADAMLVSSYHSHAGRVVEAHSTIVSTVHLGLHVDDAMEIVQMRDTNSLALQRIQ